jgi:hypothetical protein
VKERMGQSQGQTVGPVSTTIRHSNHGEQLLMETRYFHYDCMTAGLQYEQRPEPSYGKQRQHVFCGPPP